MSSPTTRRTRGGKLLLASIGVAALALAGCDGFPMYAFEDGAAPCEDGGCTVSDSGVDEAGVSDAAAVEQVPYYVPMGTPTAPVEAPTAPVEAPTTPVETAPEAVEAPTAPVENPTAPAESPPTAE